MPLSFTKMCGAGNDFLITDQNRVDNGKDFLSCLEANVPRWCHRKFGLGADGFCFLNDCGKNILSWHFFNSDGSSAEMCGNAACCLIHYAHKYELASLGRPFQFQIQDNILTGELTPSGSALLSCIPPRLIQKNLNIQGLKADHVDSGVKHLLIKEKNIQDLKKLTPSAKQLREQFPDSNITFYNKHSGNNISCVTYEKGVEDFTLSCGTGAAAASFLNRRTEKTFSVQMPGGVLTISFENNQTFLTSPVSFIATVLPCEWKK